MPVEGGDQLDGYLMPAEHMRAREGGGGMEEATDKLNHQRPSRPDQGPEEMC